MRSSANELHLLYQLMDVKKEDFEIARKIVSLRE
jgi:hypothetical protein